jgi:hypothetical protein
MTSPAPPACLRFLKAARIARSGDDGQAAPLPRRSHTLCPCALFAASRPYLGERTGVIFP